MAERFGGSRRVVDRESDYSKRRFNRTLSPTRDEGTTTYAERVREAQLDRERERLDAGEAGLLHVGTRCEQFFHDRLAATEHREAERQAASVVSEAGVRSCGKQQAYHRRGRAAARDDERTAADTVLEIRARPVVEEEL